MTLDTDSARAIAHLPQVSVSAQAHALEHALEVQLPFLQSILTDFTLLPLAVGMATAEEVAEVLETVWGGDETLIVISSDLSHYLPYATAQRVDQATTQSILKLQQPIAHDHAIRGETKSLGGDPQDNAVRIGDSHHLLRLERKCGDGLRLCDIFARAGSCHGQHPITDTFAARNDLASPKGPLTMASTNILPRLSLRMNKSRRYF